MNKKPIKKENWIKCDVDRSYFSIEEMNENELLMYNKIINNYEINFVKNPKKFKTNYILGCFNKFMYECPFIHNNQHWCDRTDGYFRTFKKCKEHMKHQLDIDKSDKLNSIFEKSGRNSLIKKINQSISNIKYLKINYSINHYFYKDELFYLNSLKEIYKIQFGVYQWKETTLY